jgi:integrase
MLYRRNKTWWYSFTWNGRRYQESTGLECRKDAEEIEAGRRVQLSKGEVGLADRPHYTIDELLDRLKQRWQLEKRCSKQNESLLKKAKADWGTKMADEVTDQDFERYAVKRRKAGYANASTNRIFQLLRRAFNLAGVKWPEIELLDEKDNVREGVFEPKQMRKVLNHLPDDGLRDYVEFAYSTGMRKGELSALRWSFLHGDSIIVPAGVCKNRRPHVIPVAGPLTAILKRRKAAQSFQSNGVTQLSEFIFHRDDGLPVSEFRKSWQSACIAAGVGAMVCSTCETSGTEKRCPTCKRARTYSGRILHDLRRTSISDMIAAQVPQSVCMAISGHKTISVFLRYAISSDESKSEALKKTAAFRAG